MSNPPSDADLLTDIRQEGNTVFANLNGEIDLHNSPKVRAQLLDIVEKQKPAKLVLNLAGVPYMDSSAIAVLVETLQNMRKHGGKITLGKLQPRVKGLLEIARLDTIFELVA